MKTLKDLSRLERIQLSFKSTLLEMEKSGKVFSDKERKLIDDSLDMNVVAKYYNIDNEKFAIKHFRDSKQNFVFSAYEFMHNFKGKECFCRVVVGEKTRRDRIITAYEFRFLHNGKIINLNLASDEFDIMLDEERALILKIEKFKELAAQCRMIEIAEEKGATN